MLLKISQAISGKDNLRGRFVIVLKKNAYKNQGVSERIAVEIKILYGGISTYVSTNKVEKTFTSGPSKSNNIWSTNEAVAIFL